MELGPDRDGRACGFGCWILGAPDVFDAEAGAFVRVVCGVAALLDALVVRSVTWRVAGTLDPLPNSSILAGMASCTHWPGGPGYRISS